MILYLYMVRRFLFALFIALASVYLLTFLFEFQQQLARLKGYGATNGEVVWLSLMISPIRMHKMIPIIFGIAALWMSLRTLLAHEYTVIRAAGMLGPMALLFPALAAFVVGLVIMTLIGPLNAQFAKIYTQQVNLLQGKQNEVFLESGGNIWFRQVLDGQQTILNAARTDQGKRFEDLHIYIFGHDGQPVRYILAESAELVDNINSVVADNALYPEMEISAAPGMCVKNYQVWNLSSVAFEINPEASSNRFAIGCFTTNLTAEQIGESFDPPLLVPFWRLPAQINQLEFSGFSATRHKVHLHMELAKPLLLAAMVLIGAGFTLRHRRGIKIVVAVTLAVLCSLAIIFVYEFARIMGEVESVHYVIAAWAPPIATMLMAIGLLSYQESR